MGAQKRAELADFLRKCRDRIDRAAVGLSGERARRVRGLRREEVAELAGISTTWYTRLEQGRDVHPSEQTLARIARALRLGPAERSHLYSLGLEARSPTPSRGCDPALVRLLDAPGQLPAYVKGPRWEILASNELFDELFGIDDPAARHDNAMEYLLSERARRLFVGWEATVRRDVHRFRADLAPLADDPAVRELVGRLRAAHVEFRTFWDEHGVDANEPGQKVLAHPRLGRVTLDHVVLAAAQLPTCRVVFFMAADQETERAFRRAWRSRVPGTGSALHAARRRD